MSAAALLLALLLQAGGGPAFVESRIECEGRVAGYECPDVNDDGRGDVVLVESGGEGRVLRVHLQRPDGRFDPEPSFRLVVPPDAVAYALADVRPERGLEIVLFAPGGVFSLSPARAGLRGNLRREMSRPLFPDLAAPDELPRWPYLLRKAGRVECGLLGEGRFSIFVRRIDADGEDAWRAVGDVPAPKRADRRAGAVLRFGGAVFETDAGDVRLFPGASLVERALGLEPIVEREESYALPHAVDWDGDGRQDLVFDAGDRRLVVHLRRPDGGFRTARMVELPPAHGEPDSEEVRLLDLDGDGRPEIVRTTHERHGVDEDAAVTVYGCDEDGLPATPPLSRTKIAATYVEFTVLDADGDGVSDLVAKSLDLPSAVEELARPSVRVGVSVFLGRNGGGFAPRPAARFSRSLRPEDLEAARESWLFNLEGDYDGDGVSDLLYVRPDGLVRIMPLRRRGGGLEFGDAIASLPAGGSLVDARPAYLSHDLKFDLVLRTESSLRLFVSVDGGEGG